MSKEDVIVQLSKLFRRYGYEGTSLTKISEATGLGRASLYHYFPRGKEEMASAVLEYFHCALEQYILNPLQREDEPANRIRTMCESVYQFYNGGLDSCFLDILSIGDAQILFQASIQRTLNVWLTALAQMLIEAGFDSELAHQQAENVIIEIEGALVLSRCLGSKVPFERVVRDLPESLGLLQTSRCTDISRNCSEGSYESTLKNVGLKQ